MTGFCSNNVEPSGFDVTLLFYQDCILDLRCYTGSVQPLMEVNVRNPPFPEGGGVMKDGCHIRLTTHCHL
jgi:hypothetical protein